MSKLNKTESNFKKAVNELLGYSDDEELELDTQALSGASVPKFFDMSDNGDRNFDIGTSETAVKTSAEAQQPQSAVQQDTRSAYAAESMIAPDMEIMGNISSSSNLTISGCVIGNVVCGGSVEVGGEVDGDISAKEIEIWGKVSGNVTVAGKVTISNGAHVKGDIVAHEVYTGGLNEGDIKVDGKVLFQSTSVVVGNVYAKTFEMSAGAKIKGLVKTYD